MRLATILHNLFLDLRFGGKFLGGGSGKARNGVAHLGANDSGNSSYVALAVIFSYVRVRANDVIADIGCGKGRVINFLLNLKHDSKIIGIELDSAIAEATAHRLAKYPNVEIRNSDCLTDWPDTATIFYLYNPFSTSVMELFCQRLLRHSVPYVVLYNNPVDITIFEKYRFKTEFHAKTEERRFQPLLAEKTIIHDFCIILPPANQFSELSTS